MASTPRRSLLSRATGAAKKVASRSTSAEPAKKAVKSTASKAAPAAKKAAPAARKTAAAAKKAPAAAKKTAAVAKKTPAAAKKTADVAKKTTAAAKKTAAVAKKAPGSDKVAKAVAKRTPEPVKKTAAAAKKTADVAKKTTSAAKKTTAATKAAVDKVPAVAPARAIAKKAVAASKAAAARNAGKLVVLEQEDPWTAAELSEVRDQLKVDIVRLKSELSVVESDLDGLMRASGEGAGNDQADVGSASFERDQEMTIANNAREMLAQTEHALERIANRTYGVCENCGNPIGKNRLMAFPRATLCMACKTREERR